MQGFFWRYQDAAPSMHDNTDRTSPACRHRQPRRAPPLAPNRRQGISFFACIAPADQPPPEGPSHSHVGKGGQSTSCKIFQNRDSVCRSEAQLCTVLVGNLRFPRIAAVN